MKTHIAFLQALGAQEIMIIVSAIFALFIIVPLIFVAVAIKRSKASAEQDYTPYHLMEPEDKLIMLQGLRAKELISEEEFDKKRKNILRELDDAENKSESKPPQAPGETSQAPNN